MDEQIKINNTSQGAQISDVTPITSTTPNDEEVKTSPTEAVEKATDVIPPTTTVASDPIKEKLEKAKLAMEGPERTAKREEREHELDVKNKLAIIDAKLAELASAKEKSELNWIKLDENRSGLRKMIDPIIEKETNLEADESQIEEQEKNTISEKDKMALEQKRWGIQEERHKAEEEKWVYENRLFKIEDEIKDNTAKYQKLLDEEEVLLKQREEVEKTI